VNLRRRINVIARVTRFTKILPLLSAVVLLPSPARAADDATGAFQCYHFYIDCPTLDTAIHVK